jgi:arsenate reductase
MSVVIYHNPKCGTSRNTLALLRHCGLEPKVVAYLETPPDRATLTSLIARSGMAVRDLLRRKGTPYDDLGLGDPALTDAHLLEAMLSHPVLINRPLVVTERGVRLCRPSDIVLELLESWPRREFRKEDGAPFLADQLVTAAGSRDPYHELRAALTAAGLPVADLDEPGRRFFRYHTLGGEFTGWAGFELLGDLALVRSLVVPEASRGRGLGRAILPLLLRRAYDAGARRAFVLALTASGFFHHLGFKPISRAEAPPAILATRQATDLCPDSATLLAKTLSL